MTESLGSLFFKYANQLISPRWNFIEFFGVIWDPYNEFKTKTLLLFKMFGFTHDRVIFYWPIISFDVE